MARPIPLVPRAALVALTGALVLLTAACGNDAPPAKSVARAADAPPGAGAPVAVQLFQFQPSPIQVKSGTAITWTNRDETVHTVTSGAPGAADGRFNGTLDGKDTSFQFTISQPGTYAYFCARHDSMRGEVRVQ